MPSGYKGEKQDKRFLATPASCSGLAQCKPKGTHVADGSSITLYARMRMGEERSSWLEALAVAVKMDIYLPSKGGGSWLNPVACNFLDSFLALIINF